MGGAVSGDVTMKEQHLARVGETSQYTGVVSSPAVWHVTQKQKHTDEGSDAECCRNMLMCGGHSVLLQQVTQSKTDMLPIFKDDLDRLL